MSRNINILDLILETHHTYQEKRVNIAKIEVGKSLYELICIEAPDCYDKAFMPQSSIMIYGRRIVLNEQLIGLEHRIFESIEKELKERFNEGS
jgi:hypothetical protein